MPDDVRVVVVKVALRAYSNPEGLAQETTGSVRTPSAYAGAGEPDFLVMGAAAMIWPDVVTVTPASSDEYANPGAAPGRRAASVLGFLVSADVLLLPPGVEISARDRLLVNGKPYAIEEVDEKRSPSRRVLWVARVRRAH